MKHLKMLGLAAIAALGLMAFVGAGTASATTLCTTNESPCTMPYPAGTTIHATLDPGTSAALTDTSGNTIATCTGSTIHGVTSNETGTWVSGNNSVLTWESCSQTTDTINAGSLEIMKTGANEGEIVSKGSNVTLQIFGVSCTYGTGEGTTLGTVKGGEAPTITITATIKKSAGGFLCPSTGIWHAKYVITQPHAIYLVD